MKKKLLLVVSIVALLVCLFTISVSAETVLKSQETDNYGELSFFDESVVIGRSHFTDYGFTPFMADGTSYARVVIGDGTTFYTFPTAYILSTSVYDFEKGNSISIFEPNFTSLNSAMQTVTGTNPGWTKNNVYRIELPKNMLRFNGGSQCFSGFETVREIYLQPNTTIINENKNCIFYNCKNLEIIHNLDSFVFRKGSTSGSFQNCAKLTNITIGVSPEVTSTGDSVFNGCTSLVSVNFQEAFPNATSFGKYVFKNCNVLNTLSSTRDDGVVALDNITYIDQNAFESCKAITAIKFGSAISTIKSSVFYNCSAVKFVYFPRNLASIAIDGSTFRGCSSLKAVALPDNLKIIQGNLFRDCTALTAVYLPANLEIIRGNKFGDGAAFYNSSSLYFTNEWFDVVDNDGNFLGDSFTAPEKKDVYYFPETLKSIVAEHNPNNTVWYDKEAGITTGDGLDDAGITNCKGLNSYLVFPKGFTGLADQTSGDAIYDENQRGDTLSGGMMYNCATKENPITLVFLGRIDRVSFAKEISTEFMTYMFANEANTSFENTLIGTGLTGDGDQGAHVQEEMYVIFCHANNGAGEKYKISFNRTTVEYNGSSKYLFTPVPTLVENADVHVTSPRDTETTDATCTKNAGTYYYCFCGVKVGSEEQENTALGHEQGNLVSRYFPAIVDGDGSLNYFVDMITEHDCTRCDDTIKGTEPNTALFVADGYSIPEKNDSTCISHTIKVNKTNVANYEALTGDKVDYGVVAGASTSLSSPVVINNGEIEADTYALVGDMTGTEYTKLVIKVTGLEAGDQISCNAYIVFNKESDKIYYLCGNTVSKTALAKSL